MEPYSLFKNDIFIRYIIDKPELYINNSKKIELEHVFPIRIVLSDKHIIPAYAEKVMSNIKEYTYDTIKSKFAISQSKIKLINDNTIKPFILVSKYNLKQIKKYIEITIRIYQILLIYL